MILLNESGRVAESTRACVLVVRDGKVHIAAFVGGSPREHHSRRAV